MAGQGSQLSLIVLPVVEGAPESPLLPAELVPPRSGAPSHISSGELMDLKALEARIRRLEEHLGLVEDAQVAQLPAVAPIVERLVGYLNRVAGRQLRPASYVDRVRAALKAGYTEAELRLVCWWACQQWGQDDRMRRHLNPDTLWKLKPGGASTRALPQYLSEAIELYQQAGRTFDRMRKFDA